LILGALLLAAILGVVWALVSRRQIGGDGEAAPPRVAEIADPSSLDVAVREAIDKAVKRARESPFDAAAHGELGRLYHAHKHIALAEQSYETAHRLDPQTPDWPYCLGVFAAERGEAETARALFDKVLALRADYLPAWYRLGDALLTLERDVEAEKAFSRCITLAPESPWGYLGMGRLLRRQERFEEAAAQLEKANRLDPNNREVAYLLAMTLREVDRDTEAQRLVATLPTLTSTALEDPILASALKQRAGLQTLIQAANRLVAASDLQAAESLYLKVLGTDPAYYDALYNLGLLYSRSGRYSEAEHSARNAVSARPDSPDARFLLAMTYVLQERFEDALPEVQKTLELEPQHEAARDLLERLRGELPR
jgi:tetratricopeptide (TPR) repeat protein